MKIVADENLKHVESLFSEFGELILLPGREIDHHAVAEADVLLIRSVTRVDENLLSGSRVKFVGTATSGVEHVDQVYLYDNGIVFAHAKGSNANAVAEYCLAALCFSHGAGKFKLGLDPVGLVGCGQVGGSLALMLRGLDIPVNVFDPFLRTDQVEYLSNAGIDFVGLANVFDCSAVSLHVPLTVDGEFPTANMIEKSLLACLSPSATFINASRGGVVNERDLLSCLSECPDIYSVLDVWGSEPDLNEELLYRANIATPHMAGYSRRAKALATQMLAEQFCTNYLQLSPPALSAGLRGPQLRELHDAVDSLDAIKKALPLDQFSAQFKEQALQAGTVAPVFDSFRKSMINRTEFSDYRVSTATLTAAEISALEQLGFTVNRS